MGYSTSKTTPSVSFWPHTWQVVVPALWASFIINILGLALPLAALQIYDRVLAQNTPGRWLMMLMGVFCAVVLEGLLRLARAHVAGLLGSRQEHTQTLMLLRHILHGKPVSRAPGNNLQILEALGKLRDFSSGQAITVVLDLPFAVIYLGLIAYLGGMLALVPAGLLLLFIGREASHSQKLAQIIRTREEVDVHRKNSLIESIEHLHTIKAFGRLRWLQRRLEGEQHRVEKASAKASALACKVYQDGLLFSQLMLGTVTMAGTPLVLSGHMTLGALIACVLLGGRLMAPIQRGLGLYSRMQEAILAKQQITDILQQPIAFGSGRPPLPGPAVAPEEASALPATLNLMNLGIRSDRATEGRWLLRRLTLQAEKGQTIAITTSSVHTGTLLMLTMAGLRPPSEGQVELNGVQPHTLGAGELVNHVAYLPPEGTIYRGTIYDNLSRFGHTPPAQVAEMIKLMELESALAVLPRGADTMLDNTMADPLPPGLKQRVALARVLAQKPKVILFNHADRGLDSAGYNVMYRLLERVRGKVLLVLCTDDQNLTSLADEYWVQQASTLKRKRVLGPQLVDYTTVNGSVAA